MRILAAGALRVVLAAAGGGGVSGGCGMYDFGRGCYVNAEAGEACDF